MDQLKGALRRMDHEFENSKKEQIISFLRDQSEFNRRLNSCLKEDEDDDVSDANLLSSINNTNLRLPLDSLSRPKTASVSRKFQGNIVEHETNGKSKISQRPRSSYGYHRSQQLKMENECDGEAFRKRANTTEMSRIEEVDAISNASTRSVTPDLEDIDDTVFTSPLSPNERNLHPQIPTQYYIRRRVKSYSSEPNTKLKPIKGDLKQLKSAATKGIFTGNTNKILPSQIKNTSGNDTTDVDVDEDEITNTDDSVSNSFVRSKSSYENISSEVQSPKRNPHGLVAIEPLPIEVQTIGVHGIAMVECDASLYRKMRNKSAPNLRHTDPGDSLRESYKVYHLPPLDKTQVDTLKNGDVTPTTTQVADLIRS